MSSLAICASRPPQRAYCRTSSPARTKLEQHFKKTYGLEHRGKSICEILPSGMAAISALMHAVAIKRADATPLFVLGNELYGDVARSAQYMQRTFPGLRVEYVDVRFADALIALFEREKNNVALLYFETCTNPSGQMFDWKMLASLRQLSPQCTFCVDNTWLTSVLFQPFSVAPQIDIVVESLSKYNSAGACIGGMILGRADGAMNSVQKWVRVHGQFVADDHCHLFLNSAHTLRSRMLQASEVTIELARKLANVSDLTVLYPLLETHPTYSIYTKYVAQQLGPACIWLHVVTACSLKQVRQAIATNTFLRQETSFGAAHSKVDPWPKLGFSDDYMQPETLLRSSQNHSRGVWIRLAIGYDDTADDIFEALQKLFLPLK